MGVDEPIVPPFPISDYGIGCMGAITAMSGLYHRAIKGRSWHGKVSLLQYDLLLFTAGPCDEDFQSQQRKRLTPKFLALRHNDSSEDICRTAFQMMKQQFPELFDKEKYCET
jgi:crotonobetainyl-CoA:carnitine CoA-transferase CaiB-like acyl-CoA transferase